MCGICGVLDASLPSRPQLRAVVDRMAATLAHRGPDGEGNWVEESTGVALGHRRLAVIDLSPGGRQPMVSTDQRYALTYNGEIYNYRELRAELAADGMGFSTESDTEVLLQACIRWGVKGAARRLIGIFAFALWDSAERTLSLVRDQLGVKPLYWCQANGNLLFASELRALAAHPSWRPEIDRDSLVAYFRYNYVPAPRTIYRDVHKLLPGSILTLGRDKSVDIAAYWDGLTVAKEGMAEPLSSRGEEAIDELELLLRDAVRRQMVADVPIGAFLSGGIDSSTVVALMQAQSSRAVKTFTIGFREGDYDEAGDASAVARHLGTEHTVIAVTAEDARNAIPSIADWFDEPFADSSQIPTFLLSKLARRHVTVALSGDGGDEVFAGYRRYVTGEMLRRRLLPMPVGLRKLLARILDSVPHSGWDRLFSTMPSRWRPNQAADRLQKLASILAMPDENAIYRRLVSQWEHPELVVRGGREPESIVWDRTLEQAIPSFLERMQLVDLLTYLPDDILTKVDRASMAVALEVRVPLLDPRVVAFGWRLPADLKLHQGKGKWALRQVLARYLPGTLIERPKMGFGIPVGTWLRGPLREWAESLLDEGSLNSDGLLDAKLVRQRWQEHLSGRRDWQHPLWCVLMLQQWKRRWAVAG